MEAASRSLRSYVHAVEISVSNLAAIRGCRALPSRAISELGQVGDSNDSIEKLLVVVEMHLSDPCIQKG